MIPADTFSGQKVAVMGLARSGLSAVRSLVAGGALVAAWDDAEAARTEAEAAGIPLTEPRAIDWANTAALVLSPGIPDRHPEPNETASAARDAGCPILCDVDLLARARPEACYIGITGTNGKSTMAALVGHILDEAGIQNQVGGNIGAPALDFADLGPDGAYVLELSSYQLERVPALKPQIAVLLNITPDHLDRHGGLDGYVDAKRMIFGNPGPNAHAVIGVEDSTCRGISLELMVRGDHKIIPVSGSARAAGGVYGEAGILYDDLEYGAVPTIDLRQLASLPGSHNWQNAAAAYAVARLMGVDPATIAQAMTTFASLSHRQEIIGSAGQVLYINDSKATNSHAAAKALACYDAIYWIAGGIFKEDSLDAIQPHFERMRGIYLIGDAAAVFERLIDGQAPVHRCYNLESALDRAHAEAQAAGEEVAVVLLSPACASFDQFDSFEARGDAFRTLVQALEGFTA
ncbi:MAG: UDP-N-acetylmuramoyl-L-alanine--D-glutamate ligase [Pseudomonadota bacterium]|nr:UDP-N-acetylmuramoyl-L-alanine--D-glutamate ligase [Pseudomonadota bacterium]